MTPDLGPVLRDTPSVTRTGFDEVYRHEYVAILRVIAVVVGDREVAAEVVQEAFVAAHRDWNRVGQLDRPDLWVRRVALNRAFSWRRRAATEARLLARLALRRDSPPAPATGDDELWAHVRRLPRRQASVIALVYIDDMSVEQAAAALDISVPSTKTHLQRARRTLATRLNEETFQ